jgi:hypothetical protein
LDYLYVGGGKTDYCLEQEAAAAAAAAEERELTLRVKGRTVNATLRIDLCFLLVCFEVVKIKIIILKRTSDVIISVTDIWRSRHS